MSSFGKRPRAIGGRGEQDPARITTYEGGQLAAMIRDYICHGTTTPFAALNVLDGTVKSHCMQHQRHQECIRFLKAAEALVSADKLIHAILDNCGIPKHPKVMACPERDQCRTFLFTSTSRSWL
ncbi:MAG: hypothetical protein WAS21_11625 [Geminicoccaceae bacterium]